MGIKDLYKVINENAPECRSVHHLSEFRGYSFAVDISIFLNKYIKSAGDKLWMNTFFLFLCTLKKHGIKTVCVFDGPNPPKEKIEEQESRRGQGQKALNRLDRCKEINEILKKLYMENNDASVPKEIQDECKILYGTPRSNTRDYNWFEVTDAMDGMNSTIDRLVRSTIPITSKHREDAKKIVEMMGVPLFQADGEAEALCSYLVIHGYADAVLTEDTDVLAYGSNMMVAFKDFKLNDETVHVIDHKVLLDTLSFNQSEFMDLCILLSCDYNHRVKGYIPGKKCKKPISIGYKGALAMVEEYRQFEDIEKYIPDPSPLIWKRCREIFTPPLSDEFRELIKMVPLNKKPDEDRIRKFIQEEGLSISIDYILENWKPARILFEFEEEDDKTEEEKETDDKIDEIMSMIAQL